jgi:uncharacterized protein YkvS
METEPKPFQAAITPGIVTGLILTGISYLLYFVDYELLASGWLGLFSLLLYCGLIIYFGINFRKDRGGYLNFGDAFQFSFFSLLIMLVVTTIGNMLLFLVGDTGLAEKMADIGLMNTMEIMDTFGAGENMSSDQIDEVRQGILDGYTFSGMLKGAGIMVIFYAILALILGAIIKKKDKSLDY